MRRAASAPGPPHPEAVLGRPLSVRKREVAQQVGFALLMLLMVFAFYNDFKRIGLF